MPTKPSKLAPPASPEKEGFFSTLYKWGLFIEKCVHAAIWTTLAVMLVAGGFAAYTIYSWVSSFDYTAAFSRPTPVAAAPLVASPPPKPVTLSSAPSPEAPRPIAIPTIPQSIPHQPAPQEPDNRDRSNPPGNPADYVWVDGHTRSNGTWVEGHWRKRTAADRAKPEPAKIVEAKPLPVVNSQPAERIWVEGYTRKNGTKVKGYWREK